MAATASSSAAADGRNPRPRSIRSTSRYTSASRVTSSARWVTSRIDVIGVAAIPRWQHIVIAVKVTSTSTVESPKAPATRSMASVVSPEPSPLDSSTSPMRMHRSITCCTCRSPGTSGPIGCRSWTVCGPGVSSLRAGRRTADRSRLLMRELIT